MFCASIVCLYFYFLRNRKHTDCGASALFGHRAPARPLAEGFALPTIQSVTRQLLEAGLTRTGSRTRRMALCLVDQVDSSFSLSHILL